MINKLIAVLRKQNGKTSAMIKNVLAAFGIKGVALCISLFTMPAYMRFFQDQEVLGVWFTVLSVLTWILSFDLGIGNGLRNKLSASLAQGDMQLTKEYISSAYWMIGLVVAVLTVLGTLLIPFVSWNGVFGVDQTLIPAQDLAFVVRWAFWGIMLQFFLRLISSILYAMQKSAINNLIALITSISQLLFVLIAPSMTPVENLKMFSVAHVVCANLPLIVATIIIFMGPLKDCRPKISLYSKNRAAEVVSLGGIFFVCQILYMIIANTNEFFISQYTNAANVVEYQIYYKLFSLASMVLTLALSPVWSAVTKAIAEKDFGWLNKLYKNLKRFALVAILGEFLLIAVLQPVVNIWLQEEAITINYLYAFSFALFGSAMLYQSVLSSVVCGMGKMKLQACCYLVGVVAKFIIIHVGVAATGSWIVVVLANAIILIPYCVLQQIQLDRFMKKNIM